MSGYHAHPIGTMSVMLIVLAGLAVLFGFHIVFRWRSRAWISTKVSLAVFSTFLLASSVWWHMWFDYPLPGSAPPFFRWSLSLVVLIFTCYSVAVLVIRERHMHPL